MVYNTNLFVFRKINTSDRFCMIKRCVIFDKFSNIRNFFFFNIYSSSIFFDVTNFNIISKLICNLINVRFFKCRCSRFDFFWWCVAFGGGVAFGGVAFGGVAFGGGVVSDVLIIFYLSSLHPFDFFLQQHASLNQGLRSRRTTRNVYIYWKNSINSR